MGLGLKSTDRVEEQLGRVTNAFLVLVFSCDLFTTTKT